MIIELTEDAARSFLASSYFGSLGCAADSELYVVPISFVLDGDRIIGQTKMGKKVEMMRQNPQVCLEVHQVDALDDWKSVILWGRYEELSGVEANEAMGKLIDHFSATVEINSGRSPRDVTPRQVEGQPQVDLIYCIHLDRITGRCEVPD